ncbi:MAG: HAD hydrolase family protein, partial [Erysipelotrichaceae bacterium]|nr:HAD hydrolase family protein [Erysipelotrichaceae bacterium]
KLSGYGIAMKNGEETVRRQRRYVTEHGCDEDGCARFLEKWGK